MKKKISVLVCVIIVTLCFTGCLAKSNNEAKHDIATMKETVETVISSFAMMDAADFEQYKDFSEYQLNYIMMNSGLRIEADSFLTIVKAWQAGKEECGAYITHGEYQVEEKGGEVVISTEAEYENRKATLSFTFSKDSYLESMDVSASYTINEILGKAGLNTLLGMGTVFAVLIFLAFIISLFKYIPNLLVLFEKNEEKNFETVLSETEQIDEIDDYELVAVITAAIAARERTTTDGFVVRSIRRRPSNNWK